MKFSINKKDISDILQHLLTITPAKNNVVAVTNFKLDAFSDTNQLKITATDFNVTSKVEVSANVIESGTMLVNAKQFSDIINSLPISVINFSIKEDHLFIECEQAKFSISYIESTFYPEEAKINTEKFFEIDAQNFKKMINLTSFCVSTETVQPALTGVYMKFDKESLTMTATDSKRISEAVFKVDIDIETPHEIVLPTKALSFIEKNINDETDIIQICFDEKRISFKFDNIYVVSNRFESKYPNYTTAFRNSPINFLTIDKISLRDALRRVSLLSDDEDKLVKITINNTTLFIESLISEKGNAKENLTDFAYSGPEVSFGINARFLLSFVQAIDTDEVIIQFRTIEEPFYIVNNKEFENFKIRFVLMPMRIERR